MRTSTTVSLTISNLTASAYELTFLFLRVEQLWFADPISLTYSFVGCAPTSGSRRRPPRLFRSVLGWVGSHVDGGVLMCARFWLKLETAQHMSYSLTARTNAPLKIDATMLISTGCRRYIRTENVDSRKQGVWRVACLAYVRPQVYYVASLSIDIDSHSRRYSLLGLVLYRCMQCGDSDHRSYGSCSKLPYLLTAFRCHRQ